MGKYKTLTFKITGVSPLLLHNGQLANPMNKYAKMLKEVSGKRAKTDADFEEMARIEFYGSLYVHNGQIVIPGEVLESLIKSGAKAVKKGKVVMGAVLCPDNYPLVYDGPQAIDDRWADEDCRLIVKVKIGQSSVMRTRPIFKEWSLTFDVQYNPYKLNERDIQQIMDYAGEDGLCDWRPKFGRFTVEQV